MERASKGARLPREKWVSIIFDQSTSGESMSGYCHSRSINYKQFLYHRQKSNPSDQRMPAAPASTQFRKSFVPASISKSRSVIIRVIPGIELTSNDYPDVDWLVGLATKLSQRGLKIC